MGYRMSADTHAKTRGNSWMDTFFQMALKRWNLNFRRQHRGSSGSSDAETASEAASANPNPAIAFMEAYSAAFTGAGR